MKAVRLFLTLTFVVAFFYLNSCSLSRARAGKAVLVVTGNIHSQIDPCG